MNPRARGAGLPTGQGLARKPERHRVK